MGATGVHVSTRVLVCVGGGIREGSRLDSEFSESTAKHLLIILTTVQGNCMKNVHTNQMAQMQKNSSLHLVYSFRHPKYKTTIVQESF